MPAKKKPAKKLSREAELKSALARDDRIDLHGRGRPLSKWKRQLLEAELAELQNRPAKIVGGIAPNIVELCKALDIPTITFYRNRKKPGAPVRQSNGSYRVDEWRVFFARVAPGANVEQVPAAGNGKIEAIDESLDGMESIKLAKMREELDDARFDRAIKRGQYLPTAEVDEAIAKCAEKVIGELERFFVQTAPHEYATHNGDEAMCREINRRALKSVREKLATASAWKP